MSQTEIAFPSLSKNKYWILAAIIVAVIAVGMTGTLNPLIALGGAVIFSLLIVLLNQPNLAVIFVTFVIYTNTAVVMIKFHDVPPILGYALPLLLVIPFMWQWIVNKRKIKINFVFILMLVYFSIMLLGSAFSRDIKLALPNIFNYVAEGLGLYFLLINTIRTPKLLKQVVWSLLIGGALIGGLSWFQQVTGTFDNNYWGFAQVTGRGFATEETIQGAVIQQRVSGPIGEKNRFAQIMLMLVPLGLFQAWGEKSKALRLTAFILTGLILIGGSLAFSRGAQVGLLLLIAIMTFMRYIKVRELVIILLGILLLLVAFPQNSVRFSSLGAIFSSEEEGGLRSADGSIQGRATEMLAAMLVFIDHPLIGVGPGMFSYEMAEYSKIVGLRNIIATREAHSLYPGVAAETGALGFITLMGIFLYTLYRLAKARGYWLERNNTKLANVCTGFFLAIVSYMTTGIFLHFAYIRYFWLIMALAAVASEFRNSDVTAETEAVGEKIGYSKG
jgi:putative inorganic carbon (HCO3(-)) transporter